MNANGQAPNDGSRVPVDTAPGPVPLYRAQKNPRLSPSSAQRVQPWEHD